MPHEYWFQPTPGRKYHKYNGFINGEHYSACGTVHVKDPGTIYHPRHVPKDKRCKTCLGRCP